jgi:hypothetical protein
VLTVCNCKICVHYQATKSNKNIFKIIVALKVPIVIPFIAVFPRVFTFKEMQMDNVAGTIQEPRKEWVTPELKKVDLEQITAAFPGGGADGGISS